MKEVAQTAWINKIDINNFALFNDFLWDKALDKDTAFKKVNIIYGRNYSGKTTLSRIFRCVEKGEIHQHYPDANFSMSSNAGVLTQNNLSFASSDIKIRVYNTDFVKENLSWLHSYDGVIEPFALLGSINIELNKQIKEIEEALGGDGDKSGLRFELAEKTIAYEQAQSVVKAKDETLNKQLSEEAGRIKINTKLYDSPNYIITTIRKDIPRAIESCILSDEVINEKKNLLKDEAKESIHALSESKPKFLEFQAATNALLTKEIKPDQPITDLINDSLLQNWVLEGIDRHKGERDSCGFCGKPLTDDLWGKLDAHFSEESKTLRRDIATQITALETAKKHIHNYKKIPAKENFYANFHLGYYNLFESWQTLQAIYSENLGCLIEKLQAKEKDIFTVQAAIECNDVSENMFSLFGRFNQIIEANNSKTFTLTTDQKNARNDLRLSTVAEFLKTINYQNRFKEIERLKKEATDLENEQNELRQNVSVLIENKRALEAQAKDESKGAELVNRHLTRFFGHDGLTLVAEGDSPLIKFKIMRDDVVATNLSEGECSLIAFCYFIARIEDELKGEELIIYIDDPISSLDSNHVFFVFSLIESVIAQPKKYAQLFISTHNLDFLKYLKRITSPGGKKQIAHFLIRREQKQNHNRSILMKMPDHIEKYSTEFNYLFEQIYSVCKKVKGNRTMMLENTYSQSYNLPNNLRKFLECYLFFKYPNNEKPLTNLDKLFDGNIPSLINRIINENSHLEHLDRAWKPMDINEIEECAREVIKKIEEIDPEQFKALVESLS